MRAWNVRLVTSDGCAVGQGRALARYLASWLWFVPALLTARLAGLHSAAENFGLLVTAWYQQYLRRPPTPQELNTRIERLRQGASQRDTQIELIDSPEYATQL